LLGLLLWTMVVFERLGTHIMGEGVCTMAWCLYRDLFGLWNIRKYKMFIA